MRIGRIPYINCYPVYGAIDRGIVSLAGHLIDGVPSVLNERMAAGLLDLSVVSAVEYARDSRRYLLLPDLAISCDGPVRSVLLFSRRPASELGGRRVIVSRSSMTSVALLELMFENVWRARPDFVPGDSELADIAGFADEEHDARLVIGDAALMLSHVALTLSEARRHAIRTFTTWVRSGSSGPACHLSSPSGSHSVPRRSPSRWARTRRSFCLAIGGCNTSPNWRSKRQPPRAWVVSTAWSISGGSTTDSAMSIWPDSPSFFDDWSPPVACRTGPWPFSRPPSVTRICRSLVYGTSRSIACVHLVRLADRPRSCSRFIRRT